MFTQFETNILISKNSLLFCWISIASITHSICLFCISFLPASLGSQHTEILCKWYYVFSTNKNKGSNHVVHFVWTTAFCFVSFLFTSPLRAQVEDKLRFDCVSLCIMFTCTENLDFRLNNNTWFLFFYSTYFFLLRLFVRCYVCAFFF